MADIPSSVIVFLQLWWSFVNRINLCWTGFRFDQLWPNLTRTLSRLYTLTGHIHACTVDYTTFRCTSTPYAKFPIVILCYTTTNGPLTRPYTSPTQRHTKRHTKRHTSRHNMHTHARVDCPCYLHHTTTIHAYQADLQYNQRSRYTFLRTPPAAILATYHHPSVSNINPMLNE